ncbi:isoprenylcysteine carboxylmethyltransferase family protein [[Pseudomonas] boreopolis]|uniref:isoprenylcysteine carboxylmethyltransferase family protein n=1 Tax=Xanthomonas boreopolis TaxID=86183 RepID=UPI003D533758
MVSWFGHLGPLSALWLLIVAAAVPMWLLERKRFGGSELPMRSRCSGVAWWTGALAVVGLFLLSFMLQVRLGGPRAFSFPEILSSLLAILGVIFFLSLRDYLDGLVEPVSQFGKVLLRDWDAEAGRASVVLGWVVKAFFLPLMLGWCYTWLESALAADMKSASSAVFVLIFALLYAVDCAFAIIGYVYSSTRIGAEIRSVDRTWLGWLSVLVCYPPLAVFVIDGWLLYRSAEDWRHWLGGSSLLGPIWAAGILALTAIYTSATMAFGPRFSNLTHRGVITSGPYRFVRHPAYISKNLSWWMISMPFFSVHGYGTAIFNSLALLCVNGIYALRAYTEERHLRSDPEYLRYVHWIEHHGLVARIFGMFRRVV